MTTIQSLLPWMASLLGGGVIVGFFTKSVHWPRDWERMVVTGPRGINRNNDGSVREFQGFMVRPAGFYRVAIVNIRDHMDNILLEVMRPTLEHVDTEGHRERWQLAATIQWHVKEGYILPACEWYITDLGEFARGMIQDTILTYLEDNPVSMSLSTASIFAACQSLASESLLEHGVEWTGLMVNNNTLTDPEIQGQAIRRVAKAIEHREVQQDDTVRRTIRSILQRR